MKKHERNRNRIGDESSRYFPPRGERRGRYHRLINTAAMAAILLTASTPASGATEPSVPVARAIMDFDNCQAAVDWMNKQTELGEVVDNFKPLPAQVNYRVGTTAVVASFVMSWAYDAQTSSTKLIVPRWPNMTTAEKSAVQQYDAALLAHEEGHHKLAKNFMANATKKLEVKGANRADADKKLSASADDYTKKIQDGLTAKKDEYDLKTRGGRNQAAAGGKNVALTCP
jgi:Bacterial protein of unknown function (DUF922)